VENEPFHYKTDGYPADLSGVIPLSKCSNIAPMLHRSKRLS